MAIPVFRMSVISRGGGRSAVASAAYGSGSKLTSAVASAAYRSGEILHDERAGQTFNYARKEDIIHTEIISPDNVPDWASDRQALWNQVEAGEKRKDAQLARAVIAALPRELDHDQHLAFVRQFVQEQFVAKGMIADVALHDKDADDGGRHPHVHIMLTLREVDANGFAATKNREWNSKSQLGAWRDAWGEMQNRYLEAAGVEERVSMASYQDQGINKQPQEHLGPTDWKLEQNGVETQRGNRNREIKQQNAVNEARAQWQPVYTPADEAAYYQKLQGAMVAVDEPDTATLRASAAHAKEVQKAATGMATYYAAQTTTTRWFGLGSRETRTALPGMAGLSRSARETLEDQRQDLDVAAGLEYHRSTVAGFLGDDRSGASAEAVEQFQRAMQFVKDKAGQFGQSILDRYASWTERQTALDREQERGRDRDNER